MDPDPEHCCSASTGLVTVRVEARMGDKDTQKLKERERGKTAVGIKVFLTLFRLIMEGSGSGAGSRGLVTV